MTSLPGHIPIEICFLEAEKLKAEFLFCFVVLLLCSTALMQLLIFFFRSWVYATTVKTKHRKRWKEKQVQDKNAACTRSRVEGKASFMATERANLLRDYCVFTSATQHTVRHMCGSLMTREVRWWLWQRLNFPYAPHHLRNVIIVI